MIFPGDFAERAACKNLGELFDLPITVRGGKKSLTTKRRIAIAVAICETCPVLEPCRDWALTTPDPAYCMVAGGLDPNERRKARGRNRYGRGCTPADCGTESGYKRHHRLAETTCQPCRDAHTAGNTRRNKAAS